MSQVIIPCPGYGPNGLLSAEECWRLGTVVGGGFCTSVPQYLRSATVDPAVLEFADWLDTYSMGNQLREQVLWDLDEDDPEATESYRAWFRHLHTALRELLGRWDDYTGLWRERADEILEMLVVCEKNLTTLVFAG